jgi:hypothetical protein
MKKSEIVLESSYFTLAQTTRRNVLIPLGFIYVGALMSGTVSAYGLGSNINYYLSDSYISKHLFAMVGRHNQGSELCFWTTTGNIRAVIRSKNEIYNPFVAENGRVIFIEQKQNSNPIFRLYEINLLDQKPEISVLYETYRFLGFPSITGDGIVMITGDYHANATGNPVPGREIAILRAEGLTVLSGAKFSTIGRICSLGGGRYLGVSAGVKLDGSLPNVGLSKDSVFDLHAEGDRLTVKPFAVVPAPLGTLLGLNCMGDKLALKSVEFPSGGRAVVFFTICNVQDGNALQRIDLPPGKDAGLPHWLPRADTEADLAAMTLADDGGPAVLVIQLQSGAMTKIKLSSDRSKDFIMRDI